MAKPFYSYREHILPARAVLAERFPAAFMRKGEPTKTPLKVGIADDVIDLVKDLPREVIKRAIGDYCSGPKYTRCMISGTQRIDIDGKPAGEVTPDAEAFAKAKEARRCQNNQEHFRKQREPQAAETQP